ncbi:amidase [Sphaerisporangium krabiense]|uniref:N-acetylmuramoyl-L-alanine amidase n=1 Tax=Sphaerisporangium krabiense TaxID=763782 RepID=A0A7W8Z856_9ACTN|nr:N-acetylmuramoyl-L-alanine amidase [Sphaerisporangium krabiense]MBB5628858.1 hypothetical protein [Sphaerisporangium krabiense]GII60301.1 amidase [Sphaerisporangium krabiense]
MREALAASAAVSLLWSLLWSPFTLATAAATPPPGASSRQEEFRAAAGRYGVPERVLLGVSYLESRWDANDGLPSVTGGYGPMHLTLGGPAPSTAEEAARLTGVPADLLTRDPAANVLGGAALLARHQRDLGAPPDADPARWYDAVARYSGARDPGTARRFAREVFAVMRHGASRVTDDGQKVSLPPSPEIAPPMEESGEAGGRGEAKDVDCPRRLACVWTPAPYQRLPGDGRAYGNHDLSDRPRSQKIRYIVVHDTEETFDRTLGLVSDPAYVSWHFTIRSADGYIAQHVRARDVAWHAGNWYVNATSIGIEHEGYLARGAWYTEAMYRSSARLVRHLAKKYGIPLDRAHILGHDNVPGTTPATVAGMHVDPGPYWDWGHYFELLGHPIRATAGPRGGLVTISTDHASHRPRYTGCEAAGVDCRPHGSSAVRLHAEPDEDAPLVRDLGRRPGPSTYDVYDHGARASTGQRFAVAARRGDWTAIWYLGRIAWFHDPPEAPTAVNASGPVVTPRRGLASVPVYGRAYPEPEAYPKGVPVQDIVPLQYEIPEGQRYAVGLSTRGEYYYATTFDPADHRVVRGRTLYYQIQFGHRVAYVMAGDVDLLPSTLRASR